MNCIYNVSLETFESVELDLEEQNDLAFKVKVEGGPNSPAKVRLVCENKDISYMFSGYSGGDEIVQFTIPVMKDKLTEGSYSARVEVLVDNRYFSPVQFYMQFKKKMTVQAEVVNLMPRKKQSINVTAQPILLKKEPAQLVEQQVQHEDVKQESKQSVSTTPERKRVSNAEATGNRKLRLEEYELDQKSLYQIVSRLNKNR